MGIEVGKYVSKPQPDPNIKPAEAIQLTVDNIGQVAEWCGVLTAGSWAKTVKSIVLMNIGTAYIHDWVVKDEDGVKIYDSKMFEQLYQPAPEDDPNMLFLHEIGERLVKEATVRTAVAEAMAKAFMLGRDSALKTDKRVRMELGVASQTAIVRILKSFMDEV